jgi:16S rRNA (guanine1516-N2)-methyltransferase
MTNSYISLASSGASGHGSAVRLAITTSLRPSAAEEEEARAAAARHGLPYAPRGGRGLDATLGAARADAALVLSRTAAILVAPGGEARRWSSGMGALRAKRLRAFAAPGGAGPAAADRDPFLEAAALREGDAVLDCTLGLGADALVAATAVGGNGRVVGVEGSPILAAWVAEGLRRLPDEAAARIEVRAGDHAAILDALPERSFDVVVFDPMFRHARSEPGGFDLVRRLADARPLSAPTLARARRVARRCVIVKDGAPGWDLVRLGLVPLPSSRGAHRYYARALAE